MHLIDYINTYVDWEESLSQPPYNLIVKTDGIYKLLKYNQIESQFGLTEVQEARGCIVRQDFDGQWIYVCRPFKKFFNYGEPWAASIDWRSAVITEKIDGSLMKLWFDYGEWHLSTNGTIDAFKAQIGETDLTFGDLFEQILLDGSPYHFFNKTFQQFVRLGNLSPDSTYLFELVSPQNRIVIPYENGIYFLACLDNETGEQLPLSIYQEEEFKHWQIQFPQRICCYSLEEVVTVAEKLDSAHEGFVVCDHFGNRIKVKSLEYLKAARLFTKGKIGKIDILRMMKENTIDDFVGYFKDYELEVAKVFFEVKKFIEQAYTYWNLYYGKEVTRKEFAMKVKDLPSAPLLFIKFTDPTFDMEHYIWSEMDYKKLARMLGYDKENK